MDAHQKFLSYLCRGISATTTLAIDGIAAEPEAVIVAKSTGNAVDIKKELRRKGLRNRVVSIDRPLDHLGLRGPFIMLQDTMVELWAEREEEIRTLEKSNYLKKGLAL